VLVDLMTRRGAPMTTISDPTAATTPDLRLYYWLHRAMRVHSARLHDALVDLDPGDRARARDIAWWYEGFKGELVIHHTLEDSDFFPALAARVPTFEHHGEDLAADHVRLDSILERLERAIRSIVDPDGSWPPSCGISSRSTSAWRTSTSCRSSNAT
jgi:hypothetical protein